MKKIIQGTLVALCICCLLSCLKENKNPATGTVSPLTSVTMLRSVYKGNDLTLAADMLAGAVSVRGVVISDHSGNNLPAGYVVIQNTARGITSGIILNMDAAAARGYVPGDSVEVRVEGLALGNRNGALVLDGVAATRVTRLSAGVAVKITQIPVSALVKDFAQYESTMVEVTADVKPVPQPGDTYSGDKALSDGSVNTLLLSTATGATFAGDGIPASATFKGIAGYYNASAHTAKGALTRLYLRTKADVSYASGPLYNGFPEDFESPDAAMKGSYNMTAIDNNLDLKTGNWKLYYAILGNTAGRDRFNPAGKQCIRLQQQLDFDAYVQMNFDLPNGASKVTCSYGAYYTDASSTLKLEYSQDGGLTWQQAGEKVSDASATPKVAIFLMDLKGKVRFRINKLGLGPTNGVDVFNGRLSIEDFAVFSN
ncbi:DUF5689 domain-containing protein [Taibaiella chishuiensis]|uniref:DUF5689 domain-containing protein n=1 Tax=Taibaiella chishuiensis TaxID=1434707 RepID=A0A2P8DDM1_9BACT|nr:DUF5689 domain-containing protein [Taibaiella chishuiensis]PSK95267.1 hypothetical protein B0I18_1011433 [Taibaiella chishuiensis]